jgi:hypothetical protein
MKTYKLWAVKANHDTTEGRGSMYDVFYTTTKDAALKIVNDPTFYGRYGVMGTPPYNFGEYDVDERQITVFESFDEYKKLYDADTKKQKALAKLTAEEKKLLGL